jgi:thioester reductase-like protein
MKGEIFLTGATGYIGSSLLRKWLDSTDVKLNLLVRTRHGESPFHRIKDVVSELYPDKDAARFSDRIHVIEGDVSLDSFGLGESEYTMLADRISHIIHCAAAARFDLELEDARRINVGGVENVLNFAGACLNLKRLDYIGTAYVAGRRTGIVKEYELDTGQQHNNTYERSKCEAEMLARESMAELPITVLRPSIVICDSVTGRASSYNGFYRALRMYHLGLMRMLPGSPSSLLDLVPVDYVADAVHALSAKENSIGTCYHLTAGLNKATTLGEIRDLAASHFGREPFTLVPPDRFTTFLSEMENTFSEDERQMMNELRLYMPYISGALQFDNSNTLKETGLEAPPVSSYFGKMTEYIMKQDTV